ncbi:MarR family winged helix-turn-helix transcriptional regulator [Agromyces bauzanensis]|uniref:MarR family transcriptional regulator n=1 Tax=Agromyces bauzanensis TaxID=1308924 RepID=A0A917PT68_9MICO|nr:MarR family winged helix-turn-helix transcriptional regulator [Agromyces bauzanensis]GGJ90780.1 hypothetical protein GCM10011372_31640 [Agromyces bauzanensis]
MNTDTDTAQTAPGEPEHRPLGFWLKLVDRRISEEIEALFADDGITRRDWQMLNLLAGTARDEHLAERLHAKPHALHRLVERGWVAGFPPEITEAGREARGRLESQVSALRERVAGAVSPEDFATTLRSLEAIARELGWDESQSLPRGRRGGRRFGHRHHGMPMHGFAMREGFGPRDGFGPWHHRGHYAAQQDVHVHVHLHDGDDHDGGEHHRRGA